jgi:hypothetical protein
VLANEIALHFFGAAIETKIDIVSSLLTVLPRCPLLPMPTVASFRPQRYADVWIVGPTLSR